MSFLGDAVSCGIWHWKVLRQTGIWFLWNLSANVSLVLVCVFRDQTGISNSLPAECPAWWKSCPYCHSLHLLWRDFWGGKNPLVALLGLAVESRMVRRKSGVRKQWKAWSRSWRKLDSWMSLRRQLPLRIAIQNVWQYQGKCCCIWNCYSHLGNDEMDVQTFCEQTTKKPIACFWFFKIIQNLYWIITVLA